MPIPQAQTNVFNINPMRSSLPPIIPLSLTTSLIANHQFDPKEKLSLFRPFYREMHFPEAEFRQRSTHRKVLLPSNSFSSHFAHLSSSPSSSSSPSKKGDNEINFKFFDINSCYRHVRYRHRYIVMSATVFRYNIFNFMQCKHFCRAGCRVRPFNVLFVILYRFIQCNYSMQLQCVHFLFSPSFPPSLNHVTLAVTFAARSMSPVQCLFPLFLSQWCHQCYAMQTHL